MAPGEGARDGGMASVRPVVAQGPPAGLSTPRAGVVLALKAAKVEDPLAVEALGREVEVFAALSRAPGEPPCPRLYDIVGEPATGIVMEWCPLDLERWWAERCQDAAAFPALCSALAEVCRRVREYAAVSEIELGKRVIHADIKPRNVLLSESGRWLLTDFGAAKSRAVEEESWVATKMILGTENFIAPEALFNARKVCPAAMDTWSIGCTLFALLRMRTLLRGGGRLPPNGTHAHHFRSHRAALVTDLHLRKPAVFADRDLDPGQFASADRLPDKDRVAIAEALSLTFGQAALEERLVADVTNLLDRALQIAPERRYTDALEMAGDFEALAIRWRELALRADGGATGPRGASAPAISPPAAQASAAGGSSRMAVLGGLALGCLAVCGLPVAMGLGAGLMWALGGSGAADEPSAPSAAERAAAADVLAGEASEPPAASSPVAALSPATDASPAGGPSPPAAALPTPTAASSATSKGAPSSGATSRGTTASPVRSGSRKAETPPAAPVVASDEPGVVVVVGAGAYLLGAEGKRGTGTVPPGDYELYAAVGEGGAFLSQGNVHVNAGQRLTFKCGFGACRKTGG